MCLSLAFLAYHEYHKLHAYCEHSCVRHLYHRIDVYVYICLLLKQSSLNEFLQVNRAMSLVHLDTVSYQGIMVTRLARSSDPQRKTEWLNKLCIPETNVTTQ